jgi:hypothetical protein
LDLVACITSLRYDETPTKIAIADSSGATGHLVASKTRPRTAKGVAVSQFAKVLQSEVRMGLLVKPVGSDGFTLIWGHLPTLLQAMDRCTAEVLHSALQDSTIFPGIGQLESRCGVRINITCADRAASNKRLEATMHCREDADSQLRLSIDCELHKAFLAQSKQFAFVPADISGTISLGMALRGSGSMEIFRKTVVAWMKRRLKVYRGAFPAGPGTEAHRYREAVLSLFASSGPGSSTTSAKRAALLRAFVNGDLRVRGEVQHFCPPGHCRSEEDTMQVFTTFVMECLFPAALPLWPRHRWLGSDLAMDWLGLACGFHGLLDEVVPVFLKYVTKGTDPSPADFDEALVSNDSDGSVWDLAAKLKVSEDGTYDYSCLNAKSRIDAGDFLKSDPLPRVVIMRVCMTPQVQLMHRYLMVSAEQTHLDKEVYCAQRHSQGLPPIAACHRDRIAELYTTQIRDRMFEEGHEHALRCLPTHARG